jgi:RNA polymerase sigma factor (sigma-70 family)
MECKMPKNKVEEVLSLEEQKEYIERNISLPEKVATKYRQCNIDYHSILSAGRLGLVEGVKRLNPEKCKNSETYLWWWVKAYILREIYENRNVHIPINKQNEYIQFLNGSREEGFIVQTEMHYQSYGQPDGEKDGWSDGKVQQTIQETTLDQSLTGMHGNKFKEFEDKEHVEYLLNNSGLSSMEKSVIDYRFGLQGDKKILQDIATEFGYTAMGIQKIEKRALAKMQKTESMLQEV